MTKGKTINLPSGRTIYKATIDDFSVVMELIEQGKAKMIKAGNPNQWSASYPAEITTVLIMVVGLMTNLIMSFIV